MSEIHGKKGEKNVRKQFYYTTNKLLLAPLDQLILHLPEGRCPEWLGLEHKQQATENSKKLTESQNLFKKRWNCGN